MRASEIINEKAVQSSWITNLTYNRPDRILTMRLSNGRAYLIRNISRSIFEQWAKAPSKGRYWHTKIKITYRAVRIK